MLGYLYGSLLLCWKIRIPSAEDAAVFTQIEGASFKTQTLPSGQQDMAPNSPTQPLNNTNQMEWPKA
jgi:hypothetical protein